MNANSKSSWLYLFAFSWSATVIAVVILTAFNYFTFAHRNWVETILATLMGMLFYHSVAWVVRKLATSKSKNP